MKSTRSTRFYSYCEESNEEEIDRLVSIVGAISVIGLLNNRARRRRNYLTRRDLCPNPRINTPWTALLNSEQDRAFILTVGLDRAAFNFILDKGFAQLWNSTPIQRLDVSTSGIPRLGRRSLDAPGALGLILHYLNSTMSEYILQEIFALTSAVCRCIRFALEILLKVLRRIPEGKISWPRQQAQFQKYADMINRRHGLLTHAFGFADGLNLPVETAGDMDVENAYYNGWTCSHYVSNVCTFAPDGTLLHVVLVVGMTRLFHNHFTLNYSITLPMASTS
jgi:hypothetical protein